MLSFKFDPALTPKPEDIPEGVFFDMAESPF